MLMTTVITARHGDAPIDGDDERPAQLGFGVDEFGAERKKSRATGHRGA
jgi:hypothetical protein